MALPTPRPARPHRAPSLKLWVGTLALDHGPAAELLHVGRRVEVAVYALAHLKGQAVEMLRERLGAFEVTGREIEAVTILGAPEIAQAMRHDDPESMITEGRLYVVHARRVVAVDEDGHARLAGTYAHRARRYHPMTPADRLGEDIATADAVTNRGQGLSEADQAALWRVIEAAREVQRELRAREEHDGNRSAFEACLDEA